mmetsp:Transcript_9036/g.19506  ORF Transcript_9036/g.19506 Transcript_9036/m.19506 type:complete len:211 (-) Transcript_9036:224-856(-)
MEKTTSNENMFEVICLKPDPKCLCGEASITHRNQTFTSRSQNSTDFFKNFFRFVQVVNAHNTCDFIKGSIIEWKDRIVIQIFRNKVSKLRVLAKLVLIHSKTNNLSTLKVFGVMRNPRAANIKDVFTFLKTLGIVLRQCRDSSIVDMVAKSWRIVKESIAAFVLASKVSGAVRPFFGKLGAFKNSLGDASKQTDRHSVPLNLRGDREKKC